MGIKATDIVFGKLRRDGFDEFMFVGDFTYIIRISQTTTRKWA
jgi:hypothetical protein